MRYCCDICGYATDQLLSVCPVCGAPEEEFRMEEEAAAQAEVPVIGIAADCEPETAERLKALFEESCRAIGLYFAMARQAERDEEPEAAQLFAQLAHEKTQHSARLAELLGMGLVPETRINMVYAINAEARTAAITEEAARRAESMNYVALFESLHKMAKVDGHLGESMKKLITQNRL